MDELHNVSAQSPANGSVLIYNTSTSLWEKQAQSALTAGNVSGIVAVANGGTTAATATDARTNLVAAKSGANTDITSVGLTTGTISTAPSGGTDIVNKTYADGLTAKWGD